MTCKHLERTVAGSASTPPDPGRVGVLWRLEVYLYQMGHLTRKVGHFDIKRLAQSNGLFCRYDNQEHSLCADKIRPGHHTLTDHHTPSLFCPAAILQRLAHL